MYFGKPPQKKLLTMKKIFERRVCTGAPIMLPAAPGWLKAQLVIDGHDEGFWMPKTCIAMPPGIRIVKMMKAANEPQKLLDRDDE